MDPCLFCSIARGDTKTDVVAENRWGIAFRDINPQAPTHLLVIPKEHITSLAEAEAGHSELLGRLMLLASKVAEQEGITAAGFRTVINTGTDGGQTVFHLHIHVIGGRPMRWPPG